MIVFDTLKEFDKDLKRLLKKYRSLISDLNDVKTILNVRPNEKPPFSFVISNLGIETCIIKVKLFALPQSIIWVCIYRKFVIAAKREVFCTIRKIGSKVGICQ